jgi:peptide/nickel transport system substrate-binding protein
VDFEIDADGMRALLKTRRGEIDVLPHVLDVHYPEQVEPVTLHDSLALVRLAPLRTVFLVLNHRHAPLAETEFRRALAMLWDRARFARELHKGLMHPLGSPLFGDPVAPVFDPKGAAAKLDAMGLRDTDADGVRDRGGKPIRLSLLVPTGSRTFSGEARAFALEARRAGILVDPINVDPSQIMTRLKSGDFDLAPMLWVSFPDDDPSPRYASTGMFNWGGYRSASADAILDEVRTAHGPAGRAPLLATLGHLLAAELPVIWLYRQDVPALMNRRVHDLAARGDEIDFLHAWVDP